MSNAIDRLEELEGRATGGPLKAESRTSSSNPRLLGPDGQQAFGLLASFYWGCHPNTPEAEAKMVDEVESLVELLAALRNAAKPLLAVVRAADDLSDEMRGCTCPCCKGVEPERKALRLALATLKETTL